MLYKAAMCKKLGPDAFGTSDHGSDLEVTVEWYREQWTRLQAARRQNVEALEVRNNPGHAWRSGQPLESEENRRIGQPLYPDNVYGKEGPVIVKSSRCNTGLSI